MLRILQRLWFKYLSKISDLKVYGIENVPKNGGFIIAANHDGYVDVDLIMYAFKRYKIHFIYEIPPKTLDRYLTRWWYRGKGLGVLYDGPGKKEKNRMTLQNAVNYLKNDKIIGIMPQGAIGYEYKESVQRRFYPGCAIISCRSNKPIIPVRILNDETYIYNQERYVNPKIVISSTIEKLKINVKNGKPVILLIGKPIYPNINKYSENPRGYVNELTQLIKNRIFELEKKFEKGELYV